MRRCLRQLTGREDLFFQKLERLEFFYPQENLTKRFLFSVIPLVSDDYLNSDELQSQRNKQQ